MTALVQPKVLAVLAALIVTISGVALAMAPSSAPPPGVLAEDSVTTTVGGSGLLPFTGAQLGLLVGVGLLVVSIGWFLVTRSRVSEDASPG